MLDVLSVFRRKKVVFDMPERLIDPKYIKDEDLRKSYIRDGYVIVKNIVSNEDIDRILETYEKIKSMSGYYEVDRLISTSEFNSDIQQMALNVINSVSDNVFKDVLDSSSCDYKLGGAIFIKNKGCAFQPHQDPPLVDEFKATASIAWIPTEDMTENNGALTVLPHSHLWAAWQRPCRFDFSPINKHLSIISKHMIPLEINKGDLIIFDSALIHGSMPNNRDVKRISINTRITPHNEEYYQYYKDKNMSKDVVQKYKVDREYWIKGDILSKPKGYPLVSVEKLLYPVSFTEEILLEQLHKYSNIY